MRNIKFIIEDFEEWYKSLKANPGQMPYDDWFVAMREAFIAGYKEKEVSDAHSS